MMKLGIILGSTRSGRLGEKVTQWAEEQIKLQTKNMELLDLRDYQMPFYEESEVPATITGPYKSEAANRWREKIGQMDAFVIVHPEYNHGYPAVLKNALDYVYQEWKGKAVVFLSYSTGPIGGARAVEQLRQVVANLGMNVSGAIHVGRADRANLHDMDTLLHTQISGLLEAKKEVN